MAYTVPTPTEVKDRFPEFGSMTDARVQAYIDEASRFVDDSWIEADYAIAIRYLAAHFMATEGNLNSAVGSAAAGAVSGPITSESLGDASVSYSDRGSGGGYSGTDAELASTPYGQRFIAMRNANHPRVLVTETQ